MEITDFAKAQGHWILAKMGKRVLRPGGKELTKKLVSELHIQQDDDLVEFAPALVIPPTSLYIMHPTPILALMQTKTLSENLKIGSKAGTPNSKLEMRLRPTCQMNPKIKCLAKQC